MHSVSFEVFVRVSERWSHSRHNIHFSQFQFFDGMELLTRRMLALLAKRERDTIY